MKTTTSRDVEPVHDGPGAGGADYNDVDTSMLGYVGLVSVILLVLVVVAVQTLFFLYERTDKNEKSASIGMMYEDVVEQQTTELTGGDYAWVDQEKKKVRIPLDVAMKQVLAELKGGNGSETEKAPSTPESAPGSPAAGNGSE